MVFLYTLDMTSLPALQFAHIFSADTYTNRFAPREGFLEIAWLSEGSLLLERDGKQVTARQGDVICLLYDKPVTITADTYHQHHTVGICVAWQPRENPANGLYLPLVTPAEVGTGKIQSIINRLIEEQFTCQSCRAKCAAEVFRLLCAIDACNRKAKRLPLPGEQLYAQLAKEYIHKHLYSPITQSAVAAHLSISPEYLCNVFKKAEGITLMRYCNQLKLQKIGELMDRENMRLQEAAALLGYQDPNYVSALYKKYYGCNITRRHKYEMTDGAGTTDHTGR